MGRKVILVLESWVQFVVMPRPRTAVVVRIGCKLGPQLNMAVGSILLTHLVAESSDTVLSRQL